ncbi:MAG: O-succinylhomoserine sulfhydrylase [Gammaproteobacteria bacterium]|nr:O-succinylhomoserine sulfhydrylase [Gammaproteobacteria bacterium]
MLKKEPGQYAFRTRAVHGGQRRTAEGEQSEALFLTSSFAFLSAQQAADRFSGREAGNVYSRFTNPTVRAFEQRLAAMEGGERCIATSSGMGAILSTCLSLLKSGDRIVASRSIFGTTVMLFKNLLPRLGIAVDFVPLTDYRAWEEAVRPATRMLFLETPSNPLTEVADIARLAGIARDRGCLLVVDNCFCTPVLQQPFAHGADLVIHSATKYLDGQGRCVGGAVVGSEELLGEDVFGFLRTAGPSMSPFNAWVFLKGLETLSVRMQAHCDNALEIARWLEAQPGVERVYYPGLPGHPQHRLASRQQEGGGGIVSFEVAGGREQAWRVIDGVELFSITANLGDAKSTITHPATTTHWRLAAEEKEAAGIRETLIRLSVGLEDPADLRADLARVLS